jgi:hypothetical protein
MPTIRLIAILFYIALCGVAQADPWWLESSQPPHLPTQQQAPAENAPKEPKDKGGESIWQRTISDPVALYTGVLTIFTGILGVSTILLWWETRKGGEVSRRLAIAAELSAKAAIGVELPIFTVTVEGFGYGSSLESDGTSNPWCTNNRLALFNLGRTQAFPLELACGWAAGADMPIPPTYEFRKEFLPGTIIDPERGGSGQMYINECVFEHPSATREIILAGETKLWFYCSLIYLDFMQTRHEARFCWRRDETGGGRYVPDPTPAYNQKT